MADVTIPTINRIYKITEFDLLRTSIQAGNMYMCLDTNKLYYDVTDSERTTYDYTGVQTLNDIQRVIVPIYGVTYYCWEDNSLWIWLNKWISIWSDYTYPSAYVFDNWLDGHGDIRGIYRYDEPGIPADDNGLLKDGSVVIRDRNRLIKGRLSIADDNTNFIISSYIGGGIKFLPNGLNSTRGEFYFDGGQLGYSYIRSQFRALNNEMYIDYSEENDKDTSMYQNDNYVYHVLHTGICRRVLSYTTTIGDGEHSEFTIEHGMGTETVLVQCRATSTKTNIELTNTIIDKDNIKITTQSPLSLNEVTVTLLGIVETEEEDNG